MKNRWTEFLINRIDRALDEHRLPGPVLKWWISRSPDASAYLSKMENIARRMKGDLERYLELPNLSSHKSESTIGVQKKIHSPSDWRKPTILALAGSLLVTTVLAVCSEWSLLRPISTEKIDLVHLEKNGSGSVPLTKELLPSTAQTSETPTNKINVELMDQLPIVALAPELTSLIWWVDSKEENQMVSSEAVHKQKNEITTGNDSERSISFSDVMNANPVSAYLLEYYIDPVFAQK